MRRREQPKSALRGDGCKTPSRYASCFSTHGASPRNDPCFVKKGGTLIDARGGTVFHEPGAILGEQVKAGTATKIVEVPAIGLSLGIEPFIFTPAPALPGTPTTAPLIVSIDPGEALPGEVVSLRGEGFTGTSQVTFYPGSSGLNAGFRVLSDTELEVQVPDDNSFGRHVIGVTNIKGTTLTVASDSIVTFGDVSGVQLPAKPRPRRPGEPVRRRLPDRDAHPLVVIGKGLVEKRPEDGICLVMEGGTLVRGGRICFVQAGGRVADLSDSFSVFRR